MKNIGLLLVLLSIICCGGKESKTEEIAEVVETVESKTEETSEVMESADIFEAAENGDLKSVQKFIADGFDVNIETENDDMMGTTPLMLASREGHTEVVKLLIKKCAVNLQNRYGYTALMLASWQGHTEVAKLLVEAGVDINIKDEYGITALMLASGDSAEINIRETASDYTAIPYGYYGGHLEIVKSLVKAGADTHSIQTYINAKDNKGNTSLMYASEYGHTEIVKFLIDNGADINVKNDEGNTALYGGFS